MATLLSVKQKALRRLGVLGAGQTMSGDQDTQVTTAYNSIYDRLLAKDLVAWAKNSDVPDSFVESFVSILAFELANEYGVSDSRWQRLQLAAMKAEPELRILIFPSYVSTTEAVDY